MNEHVKTNLSMANWKGRLVRLVTVTVGYWIGLEAFSPETTWERFGTIISNPVQVGGLVLIWVGALFTSGVVPEKK